MRKILLFVFAVIAMPAIIYSACASEVFIPASMACKPTLSNRSAGLPPETSGRVCEGNGVRRMNVINPHKLKSYLSKKLLSISR